MNRIVFTKNHFSKVKNVSWDDVIAKISKEYKDETCEIFIKNYSIPPTIVCRSPEYSNTIMDAYNEVKEKIDVKDLHIYTSLGTYSSSLGRHTDPMDVLIVQAVGSVEYFFDDGSTYRLEPGDSIYIPENTYHNPIILSHRITLSFEI